MKLSWYENYLLVQPNFAIKLNHERPQVSHGAQLKSDHGFLTTQILLVVATASKVKISKLEPFREPRYRQGLSGRWTLQFMSSPVVMNLVASVISI